MLEGRTQVLVVGAGPAGSAAAIAAARGGADVVVLDRARFPRDKICGDAISNTALGLVDGLVGKGAALGVPGAAVNGAVAVFPDGSVVRRSYGDRPGRIIERDDFDYLLRQAAERAGARVVEGTAVRRLLFRGGQVVGAHGPAVDMKADVVIVADGTASLAWDALGLEPPEPTELGVAMTAYYRGLARPGGESEHYFEKDLPAGYGWIFPEVDGRSNIGVYLRVDRYRAGGVRLRELFRRFVERHRLRFQGAEEASPPRSWSLPLATFRPVPAIPGLLVAGDAARLVDPLTGEGIWHALASGELAGRLAAGALSSGGIASLPADYRRAVRREIAWPTALRRSLEAMTTFVVDHDLYRSRAVLRALEWGYNRKSLEIAKTTAGAARP
ncbi:MAG TPA: geranylgeranyl reductase family protein [Polyangiaceae bacterium]|nr:geranylgeranyl reductase family protein [Polyangiaceae bacterium]